MSLNSEKSPNSMSPQLAGMAERLKPIAKPIGQRIWLNLRVWAPFLASPTFRACTVKYTPKDGRDRDTWKIELPQKCWKSGDEKGLVSRQYRFDVRSYESPLSIIAVAVGLWLLCWLLALWMLSWKLSLVGLVCLAGGAVMLLVKSWTEPVQLTVFTRLEHGDDLKRPDAVAYDNDLYLVLPNAELAEAAQADIVAKRRTSNKYAQDKPADRDPTLRSTPEPQAPAAAPPKTYKRDELPPIKLDE